MPISVRFLVVFAFAVPAPARVLMTTSTVGSPTNTNGPQHTNPAQTQTQTPDRGASSANTENRSRPEITIADYLLHPRARIDKLLGSPQASGDCVDTTGKQFEYKDGSYACVRNGKVVLFSYNLRTPVKSAQEVLKAVGIDDSTEPYDLGVALLWSFDRGNPLKVGNGLPDLVTVFLRRAQNIRAPNTIIVEMDGSHPMSKPAPRPQAAAVAEYLGLYQSDFPGVFEDAKLESGVLVLYVSSQWSTLGANTRREIVESLGDRWQAVNHGYGNSVWVAGITIRRQATGAVIGKWPK